MIKIKQLLKPSVVLLSVALCSTASAKDLFILQENSAQPLMQASQENDKSILNSYIVNGNSSVLETDAEFDLPLNAITKLRAFRHELTDGATGSKIWKGQLQSIDANLNAVNSSHLQSLDEHDNVATIVTRGDEMTGTIRYDGRLFQLRPTSGNKHLLLEIDESNMPPDHPSSYYEHDRTLSDDEITSLEKQQTASVVVSSAIRTLVAYTPAAKRQSGNIRNLIDLAIYETNIGYRTSGINAHVVLAHSVEVNYYEGNNSYGGVLRDLRARNDGNMDEIHRLRNQYSADVVVLIIDHPQYCGLAGYHVSASNAFALVSASCATGYYSFGHEIGHLLSADHEPANGGANGAYSFGYGYQAPNRTWRTVMSYNCSNGCPRMNFWSNPRRYYRGSATGTARKNDNARVLNIRAPTVAAFR